MCARIARFVGEAASFAQAGSFAQPIPSDKAGSFVYVQRNLFSGSTITVTLAHTVPVAISGTSTYTIVALITNRCAYTVSNGNLQ